MGEIIDLSRSERSTMAGEELAWRLAAEQWQRLNVSAQSRLGGQGQPLLQYRGVDTAEVHRHLEVAVLQVQQLGRCADQPGPHAGTSEEDGPGGAVVGALRAVLLDAAAEFTEAQHRHPFGQASSRQVIQERLQGARQLAQQVRM